jgi:hypothetical protein
MPLGRWGSYVAVVLIVSLITWIFFYLQDMPLDSSGTSFVVTAWAVIVWLVWSCVSLFRKLTMPQRILVAGVGMVMAAVVAAGLVYSYSLGRSAHGPPRTQPQPPVAQSPPPVAQSPEPPVAQPQPPVAQSKKVPEPQKPTPGELPGVPIETGREILYPTHSESSGYALYSYILFRGATNPLNEDRYLAALTAFLDEIPEIGELIRRHARRSELNIAYIPLKENPVTSVPRDWLEQYDFARARLLLRAVPITAQDGPYVVSYDRPLSTIEHSLGRKDLLLQDLSWVPAPLVRVWVKEFLRQASQPGAFAKEDLWRQLTLKTRTGIDVAAKATSEVEAAWADAREKWDTAVKPVTPKTK